MFKNYKESFLISILIVFYSIFLLYTFESTNEIDYYSVLFEGSLVVLSLLGLFFICELKKSDLKAYRYIFLGLTFTAISLTTDTLDEIVEISKFFNILFEGLFEISGFLFLVIGINLWAKHSEAQKNHLNKIATTDYLTKIMNRRVFMEELRKQENFFKRYKDDLCVILFDLDNFKKVNDTLGHEEGDKVLIATTKLIKQNIRTTDIFARYGGEEFVILLPKTNLEEAFNLASKLAQKLDTCKTYPLENITASFGVSQLKENEKASEFLKRADNAMYKAKENGKNCVVK